MPHLKLPLEESDDQGQVAVSLPGLPEPEEVSPGCRGQAPLTPLTQVPSGAPVGTLAFPYPWVDPVGLLGGVGLLPFQYKSRFRVVVV